MKIDIVNPIPPRNPTAINWFQFVLLGNVVNFNFIAIKIKETMPSGFPMVSPKKIPKE